MQQIVKTLTLLLVVLIILPGCSSFSRQGRVERAHRKYVQKTRRAHQKQTAKAIKEANRPLRQPSEIGEPMTSVTLESSPSDN